MSTSSLSNALRTLACLLFSCTSALAAEPAKPKITISKETTYITEPLRPDGYPDYVAAIDQRMREGVTPENNAAVLLQKAFGPKAIPEERRAKYFERLGIESLSDQGRYFVDRDEMVKRWKSAEPKNGALDDEQLSDQFDRATERPWSAEDLPMVAEWLNLNDAPLQLVVEASKRSKCYFPVLADDDGLLIAALIPHAAQSREVAVALSARAMLRTKQGRIDDAWNDLMSCHQLGRHIAQGFCMIEYIVGIALDRIAALGDIALAHYGNLSALQSAKMRQDLSGLPRFTDISRVYGEGERMVYLSSATAVSREGLRTLTALIRQGDKSPTIADVLDEKSIDWNVGLKIGNEWYDRFETAAKITDVRQRRQAMKNVDNEFGKMVKALSDRRALFNDLVLNGKNKEIVSSKIGYIMTLQLVPAIAGATNASDRCTQEQEMLQAAFALAAYRTDQGQYPRNLEALVPKYIAKVPEDIFRPQPGPIGYRQEGDAYVLWTVHLNGIDENGASYEDQPSGDDWVLRPVPRIKN